MSENKGDQKSELTNSSLAEGIEIAIQHGRGATLVAIPEGVDSAPLAYKASEKYNLELVSATDLSTEKYTEPSKGKDGIIVYGYNAGFAERSLATRITKPYQKCEENNIQSFVRSYKANNPEKQVLVISEGRPSPIMRKLSNFWWYNGPFSDESIWEIGNDAIGTKPTNIRSRGSLALRELPSWTTGEEIHF